MKWMIYRCLFTLMRLLPLNKRTVYFSSFNDLYNDNPKYISQALYKIDSTFKHIWVVSKRTNMESIPKYVICVQSGSLLDVYYKACSCVLIDNYIGALYKFGEKTILNRLFFYKRTNQINVSTWHGTPLKYVGKDVDKNSDIELLTLSTAFIANSVYEKSIFEKAFDKNIPTLLLGSARNDILFDNTDEQIITIKKRFQIPLNKKLVIYAPTFRSGLNGHEAESIYIENEDIVKCLKVLQTKFGGEWMFIYRAHQKVMDNVKAISCNSIIIDGNLHDDMAEYLAICDVLITDYSGSLFDYTFTQKPCFLYTPDLNNYLSNRGLYMDLNELPYSFASNINELLTNIVNYNDKETKRKIDIFNRKIGAIDDGKAAVRIAEYIINEVKKHENYKKVQ